MPIHVALHHKTTYHYDRLVKLSPQVIRLRPAPHCRTPILSYSLKIDPAGHFLNWQQDPQSNYLARAVFPEPARHFSVEVDLVAEMTVINPFDFFLEPEAENFPFHYPADVAKELKPFLETVPGSNLLNSFVKEIDLKKQSTADFLVGLNQKIQHAVGYVIRMEPGVQTSEETLAKRTGSCRDSAWLMVQVMRELGLAARFVSGYLIQLLPDIKPLDGPIGPLKDFTDLHAWAEVYLPGAGWIGLDPTSGLFAGEGHIPVAATPDPSSAAPVSGAVDACQVTFTHEMSVSRIHEDPRVTLPYSDSQWNSIEELGYRVDKEIVAGDIRLTMGGEPTFVSMDNMDGDEWNTTVIGPEKRLFCARLIERLRSRYAPGGLLHIGQGKWYPGEPLPRWAFACYWRTDGVPLWKDRTLLASEETEYAFTVPCARRFLDTLAARLGLDPAYIIDAFEDSFHFLRRERELPINVDPRANKLEDPNERDRLRKVFTAGLDTPTGFVLPLQRGESKEGKEWQTGLWRLRSGKLYLMPGDSPVGLRLPLPSLPWIDPDEPPSVIPEDPMRPLVPLPVPKTAAADHEKMQPRETQRDKEPKEGESASWVVRTAICVEPRGGRLHVFMPPLTAVEDYLEMLSAIEDTAAKLKMPVVIEGYTPPYDPRINCLKVTPDPGVIEVNVQPASSWKELVANTTSLYDDARLCGLGTEKFMLDGRHSGTGGGNHVVLGAQSPSDSPFLRRPDLLRSMIGYWLNHPSLSYLFSGMFIGPTSQAPRIDETGADSLYELEIAFNEVPEKDTPAIAPWLVDRIFRHLLVDVTGNTHRAEFCIDKLYSPDTATGRLGLLEMRGFEMPPHARMSLTQQLLTRTLVAWFWKQPFNRKPIYWGTQLHDQFMLPHFIQRDFSEVVDDLNRAGYPFDTAWFAPHLEFRYPVAGHVNYLGINIELRYASEPWYVLGEEPGAGGAARYVDSSVERLQVKVSGLFGDRYIVAVNGRRVPLHSTGTHGEFVAGVRYRAWQPPSCLHPTIKVHVPLVFDLIDTLTGRSIGGCTYHVSHPGGRSYSTFPVNANEAESRRGARFIPFGHSPGPRNVAVEPLNPQFPYTLDLRRGQGG